MAFRVVLIGCGNLGSRHLQALKQTKRKIKITVCEPDDAAKKIALERYNQIIESEMIENMEMISDYRNIPKVQDLVIIATSAQGRFEIAKWVVEELKVKYLLLEKVVFQSINELEQFSNIIRETEIKVWVNCPRRMFSFYKRLKDILYSEDKVDMYVSGSDWGMGCNSVHLIDIYQFLTEARNYEYKNVSLEDKIYESKRLGYKEFFGEYSIETEKGILTIGCSNSKSEPFVIEISTLSSDILIEEGAKKAIITDKVLGKKNEEYVDFTFQSNLTNKVVEQLIDNDTCELVTYSDSKIIHEGLIKFFINHIKNVTGKEEERCPIT